MARKKVNEQELLSVTGELLLERGYNGFHFRVLAEKLNIGRSTIYEYYASKDELILSYMNHMMNQIMKESEQWRSQPPLRRLKGYLSIFMKNSQIHRLFQILPLIDRSVSPEVEQAIDKLFDDHLTVYTWLTEAIEEAKEREEIRRDLPTQLIASIIFSSVQLPSLWKKEESITGETVFDLLYRGFHT